LSEGLGILSTFAGWDMEVIACYSRCLWIRNPVSLVPAPPGGRGRPGPGLVGATLIPCIRCFSQPLTAHGRYSLTRGL
jgi:hypothetical protein